ncbi:MAG TPA: SCO family protein [Anaeromyxobacteraceae bacterium]|nr:SCO family protein [Anaeromyxobacteraceae bacterium]
MTAATGGIAVAAALAAALAVTATPAPARAAGSRWGRDYFPDVTLTTHEGKAVRFYDDLLAGKVVAVDLVYTHCKYVCPLETARLAQVQRLLGDRVGKDVFFYSISIDPGRDTPEVLKAYAETYGVGPGWLFLTGKPEDVKLVANKLGLKFEADPVNRDGHAADLVIGDVAAGQWMKNSAVDDPRFLAHVIGTFLDRYGKPGGARSYAEAAPIAIRSKGEYLFSTRCSACHSIGGGDRVGPDLAGVTRARERGWLARYLSAPDELLAAGDPVARGLYARYREVRMPNLRLGDGDVAALIEYLDAQPRAPGPGAPSVPAR